MTTQASAVALRPLHIDYGEPIENELAQLADAVDTLPLSHCASSRWVAIKLLEEEPVTVAAVEGAGGGRAVAAFAREAAARVRAATGEDPSFLIADRRFDWSHRLAGTAVRREAAPRARTERLDDILTSRWFGIPIFLGLMWIVFKLVTGVAGPLVDWVGGVVAGPVSSLAGACLDAVGLSGTWFEALIVGGIIAGVGSVVVFIPVLVVLYTALGVLEDSGYMARAAFLMDRVMRPIGLNGKSFLPLLLGFGCNVPGVYATRVLDRRPGPDSHRAAHAVRDVRRAATNLRPSRGGVLPVRPRHGRLPDVRREHRGGAGYRCGPRSPAAAGATKRVVRA